MIASSQMWVIAFAGPRYGWPAAGFVDAEIRFFWPVAWLREALVRTAASDNLLDHAFEASVPNQKWVADFTVPASDG